MNNGLSVVVLGYASGDSVSALGVESEVIGTALPADAVVVNHTEELNAVMLRAKHDWLLVLREGERINTALAEEIEEAIRGTRAWGYRLGVDFIYCGTVINRRDTVGEIRLVHRRHARFKPNPGAREMFVQGTVVRLQHRLRRVLFETAREHREALEATSERCGALERMRAFLHAAWRERLFGGRLVAARYWWVESHYRC